MGCNTIANLRFTMRFPLKPLRQIAPVAIFTFSALNSMGPALRAEPSHETKSAELNTLSPEEKNAGWKLLFDGKTTAGWRTYKGTRVPASWKVRDGSLVSLPKAGESTGQLVTLDQFGDFELALEWKMAPKGNSGIIYQAMEDQEFPWQPGPDYQLLDNAGHLDGNNPLASSGACYAVYALLAMRLVLWVSGIRRVC